MLEARSASVCVSSSFASCRARGPVHEFYTHTVYRSKAKRFSFTLTRAILVNRWTSSRSLALLRETSVEPDNRIPPTGPKGRRRSAADRDGGRRLRGIGRRRPSDSPPRIVFSRLHTFPATFIDGLERATPTKLERSSAIRSAIVVARP